MTDHKNDKLDYMLFAAMGENLSSDDIELYDSLDESQAIFTHRFEKRKKRAITKEKRRPRTRTTCRILCKTAFIIMIIMSALFITIMSVSAFRNAIVDVVIDFFEGHMRFSNSATTSSEAETLIAKGIVFSEDGVTERIIVDASTMRHIAYYKGEKRICSLLQSPLSKNDVYYDESKSIISVVDIGGFEGILIKTSENTTHLCWSDGDCFYTLSCYDINYDALELAHKVR